jgi:hypothetical protein
MPCHLSIELHMKYLSQYYYCSRSYCKKEKWYHLTQLRVVHNSNNLDPFAQFITNQKK